MDILIKCNVGPRERLARMAVGVGATAGAFLVKPRALKIALGTLGASGMATAVTRFCPINEALGITNCQPYNRSVKQLIRRI